MIPKQRKLYIINETTYIPLTLLMTLDVIGSVFDAGGCIEFGIELDI